MRKILIFIAILLFTAVSVPWGFSALNPSKKKETYKQLELFADSLAFVLTEYVDEMGSKDLIYGAIAGMVNNLDSHSQFLTPQEHEELKVDTEGRFGGIGIELTMKDNMATIITPIEDTPAWTAGLAPYDRIIKIDDEVVRNLTLNEIVKKLRGRPGTEVVLVVWREKEDALKAFKIKRAMIHVKDIKEARILEDSIGFLKVAEFRDETVREFDRALERLKAQGADSLIIDLRNNPGGLLDRAAEMAERFLPPGRLIVSLKSRDTRWDAEIRSRFSKPILDWFIVVLVNEGSASGSEIFAGALQDHRRAIILGVKTFGKGSVQTVLPLQDGSALKLTTSRYFTPLGRSIHEKGIEPDVVVKTPEGGGPVEDATLRRPPGGMERPAEGIPANRGEEGLEKLDISDLQLARAVELLEGVKVYKKMLPILGSDRTGAP